jgi:hypothetical protein
MRGKPNNWQLFDLVVSNLHTDCTKISSLQEFLVLVEKLSGN